MGRYLKITKRFLMASIARAFVYRSEFVAATVSTLYWFSLAIVSLSILTYQADTVGGWNRYELFVVQGVYSIVIGLMYGIIDKNISLFIEDVWQGNFDFKLLKPLDSQFVTTVGYFKTHALARIIAGIILIIFSLHALQVNITFAQLIVFLIFLVSSLVIIYSLSLLAAMVCFWSPNLFNLSEAIGNFISLTRYPIIIFRQISEVLMYILLPFVVITSVPAQILLNKFDASLAFSSLVIACMSFIVVRILWFRALRSYTSASS